MRIEGKRHAPDTIASVETQLFQVGVTRTAQSIGIWTTQLRAVDLDQSSSCKDAVLHCFGIIVELAFKRRMKLNNPFHYLNIASKQYSFKTIIKRRVLSQALSAAGTAYLQIINPETNVAERERLTRELLAYCKRDTLAMVELVKYLSK